MRTVSGASLTAAVSNAGGLGFFGAGYSLSDASVLSDLSRVSSLLSPSLPVAVPNTNPFGLGFILFHALLSEALELTQRHRPAAVWFFAPRDVGQLREWIVAFRKEAAWCRVFVQVGSVAEAREVAEMVDVVVAQGTADAGGHGRMVGGSVVSLVPEVRDLIAEMGLEGSVAVVAAGGIVDGRGVAAALCLGAHGVVLGTRLVACKESTVPEGFRRLVLETNDGGVNTVRWVPPPPRERERADEDRTRVYDNLRGTGFWPVGYGGRAIINESWRDAERGMEEEENKRLYAEALEKEDFKRLTAYAYVSPPPTPK
jgi:nitronate monooxygenase